MTLRKNVNKELNANNKLFDHLHVILKLKDIDVFSKTRMKLSTINYSSICISE